MRLANELKDSIKRYDIIIGVCASILNRTKTSFESFLIKSDQNITNEHLYANTKYDPWSQVTPTLKPQFFLDSLLPAKFTSINSIFKV